MRDSVLIDLLGGPARVARLCGVTVQATTQWKTREQIPFGQMIFLAATLEKESHGLVNRKDLFPESYKIIWPELQ